jgi:acetyl-CoA carboxylase carboxyltransferase component
MTVAATALVATDGPLAPRLERLCDQGSFMALGGEAGGGARGGRGRVAGRTVFLWANDGSPAAAAEVARTISRADGAGAPVIGLAHTGTAPAGPAVLRAQARATVPQITVVAGPSTGLAALGDVVITAGQDAGLFLADPVAVERTTGEFLSLGELGGPSVHERNGVAHLRARDDAHAAKLIHALLSHLPPRAGAALPLTPPLPPEGGDPGEALPADPRRAYDVRAVVRRIVDGGTLLELAPRWARNIVVGLARLEGRPVGVVASQPRHLGGYIDGAAAEKAAWFVGLCDRFGLPLLVLVDSPGFLPGSGPERDGAVRHGAALARAFATAVVPRVTVTLRRASGGAEIAMNPGDLGADRTLAWRGATGGPADEIVASAATRGSVCAVLGASA